jgi:hypothetical protein
MTNIFETYIPKFLVTLKNKENDDLIFVSSSNFSTNGDVYILDKRVILPNVIETEESLNNIQPDVSDVYPFKVVLPLDADESSILYTPTIENPPTASQYYYTPLYFERYRPSIVNAINRDFTELTLEYDDDGPDIAPPGVV